MTLSVTHTGTIFFKFVFKCQRFCTEFEHIVIVYVKPVVEYVKVESQSRFG